MQWDCECIGFALAACVRLVDTPRVFAARTAVHSLLRWLNCDDRFSLGAREANPRRFRRIDFLYRERNTGHGGRKYLWRELKATNQYGVTRGALAAL